MEGLGGGEGREERRWGKRGPWGVCHANHGADVSRSTVWEEGWRVGCWLDDWVCWGLTRLQQPHV